MPVGPVGSVIYANQMIPVQASKQTEVQNALQMQSAVAAALQNEKEDEVQDIRPTEETYKIDPEKEHEHQRDDEENTPEEQHASSDEPEEEISSLPPRLLDIKA